MHERKTKDFARREPSNISNLFQVAGVGLGGGIAQKIAYLVEHSTKIENFKD